jgi:hypothetical protein
MNANDEFELEDHTRSFGQSSNRYNAGPGNGRNEDDDDGLGNDYSSDPDAGDFDESQGSGNRRGRDEGLGNDYGSDPDADDFYEDN